MNLVKFIIDPNGDQPITIFWPFSTIRSHKTRIYSIVALQTMKMAVVHFGGLQFLT